MIQPTGAPADATVGARQIRSGVRLLLGPRASKRFVALALGSVVVSAFEVVGLLLIVPLVQLISSTEDTTGVLATMSHWFGDPSRSRLALILASIVMFAFILKAVFVSLFRWWATGFVFGQEAATASDLLDRYMHAPYWLHLQRNTAEFLRTLNDSISLAYSGFIMGSVNLFTELVVATTIVVVLIVVQPLAALSVALYFLLAGVMYMRLVARRSSEAGKILNHQAVLAFKAANQALGSVKEIKISHQQAHFTDAYRAARQEMARVKRLTAFLNEFPKYLLEVLFIVGVGILCLIVVARSTSKDVLGLLALFVAAGFRLLPSLVKMMASYSSIRVGRRGFDLIVADISAFPENESSERAFDPSPMPIRSELRVDDLTFAYSASDVAVLRNVSFTLQRGTSLGIVGLSGAGKSTLVDLILGLHQPDSGRISVDGRDIGENLPGWQTQIGLVPQDVYLLDDSFTANIAFGLADGEVDREAVALAVRRAELTEFVDSLPDGIDTVVGERGMRLSGGQRQRIGIARALYASPSLLILDEATSALDNETEVRISDTVESLHGELTMIVVAHRLSTIRRCDQILFLEDGEVRDLGTFEELNDRNESFANLTRLAGIETT